MMVIITCFQYCYCEIQSRDGSLKKSFGVFIMLVVSITRKYDSNK